MHDNGIQIFNVPVGPGSQEEGDMVLDYMKMPSEMSTYDIPILPEAEQVQECHEAVRVMDQLQQLLAVYKPGEPTQSLALDKMPAADLDMLNQVLGEGEVSVVINTEREMRIQETVMAGVWRLRSIDETGETMSESLEVADIPACVRASAFATTRTVQLQQQAAAELLNAPSVLVEIAEHSAAFTGKKPEQPHVINLSLLPFSPEDHQHLAEQIGTGAVTILSRGYGNCRISSTRINGLWRVQYFNSTDQLILDTLEITDIPAVACAAAEDLADSAERLHEIREVLS